MTLTVLGTDGNDLPYPVTVTVPHNGTLKDLVDALHIPCPIRDDETLLIFEVCLCINLNHEALIAVISSIFTKSFIREMA